MDVLIGSRALEHWNSNFKTRDNSDWDIITDKPKEYFNGLRVEIHSPNDLNNIEMIQNFTNNDHVVEINGFKFKPMDMMGLIILKRSHLWREWGFQKHITHYTQYMNVNSKLDDIVNNPFCKRRIELTKQMVKQPHPSLNKSNKSFFDDPVNKIYDHDWIHELTAYTDAPMYTKMKRNFESAWCEKDMWDLFTHEQKIMCTCEEIYVISCERFLIPNDWPKTYFRAYHSSLQKVCTTLTSGWFRDFAIDNYSELLNMYDKDKFDDIKGKICNAKSKRYYSKSS